MLHREPKIRKIRAKTKLRKSIVKVTKVDFFELSARVGVRLIASIKAMIFAYELMRPQLMLSPTPRWAV